MTRRVSVSAPGRSPPLTASGNRRSCQAGHRSVRVCAYSSQVVWSHRHRTPMPRATAAAMAQLVKPNIGSWAFESGSTNHSGMAHTSSVPSIRRRFPRGPKGGPPRRSDSPQAQCRSEGGFQDPHSEQRRGLCEGTAVSLPLQHECRPRGDFNPVTRLLVVTRSHPCLRCVYNRLIPSSSCRAH